MNFNDIKILLINMSALAISITQIEVVLKIVLLMASIVYTLFKIYEMNEKRKNGKDNK